MTGDPGSTPPGGETPPAPSPYAPPQASLGGAPPPAPASKAPKVFGILSIIFGSLMILGGLGQSCGGLAGGAMTGAMGSLASMAPDDTAAGGLSEAMTIMSAVTWVQVVEGLIFIVMSSLLLAIGIGQLKYRRWARAASVYWGAAALVCVVIIIGLMVGVVMPATERMMAAIAQLAPEGEMPPFDFVGAMGSMGTVASIFGNILFYSPYLILLLIFFTRPRVQDAMTQ